MKISDLISMCLQNLTRRKVRTMLTIVGVVVGTCAIVVMISIGVGMSINQEAMLAQMGDLTMIEVYNYNGDPNATKLDDKLVAEFNALDGVQVATPFYRSNYLNASIFSGKNDRYEMPMYEVIGIYPEAIQLFEFGLNDGDYLTEDDEPYTVMFGQYAAYSFRDTTKDRNNRVNQWPDQNGNVKDPFVDTAKDEMIIKTDPQEEDGKVREYEINVVGTLIEDYAKAYETSRGVFMDIDDLKRMEEEYIKDNKIQTDSSSSGETNYDYIKVKVESIDYVEEVEEYIREYGFDTWSMEQIRKPMEEQAQQLQMVLGSLGAISLFVAALGITNTMIMSIYERTREIGVMKVLGCYISDIRTVFLMESGLIGFIGGVIGIILSYIISFSMNYFGFNLSLNGGFGDMGGDVSVIPMWLIGFAMVFATLIGLVSGFYPANRAVQISALEAIRQDT